MSAPGAAETATAPDGPVPPESVYAESLRHLTGRTVPTQSEFADLARTRRVVPVVRKLLADGETPIGLYRKLAGDLPGTFLLESAEHGRVWSRYSFIGVRSSAMLAEVDGQAHWSGTPPEGVGSGSDPLEAMRDTLSALHTPRISGLPPLTSGLVGVIGYDAVRRWERIPDLAPDELQLPEVALLLVADLAVVDHQDGSVLLVANAFVSPAASVSTCVDQYRSAVARLDRMQAELMQPAESTVANYDIEAAPDFKSRTPRPDYLSGVEVAREHIHAGDAFQIVLSQRFEMQAAVEALDVYRVLRVTNPSPYMYLFHIPPVDCTPTESNALGLRTSYEVVGSSPEALVRLNDGHALLHPIAGTRPRGASTGEDSLLAEELLADKKERAEHLMLVDLGRNDLGRVATSGSVEVVEFMQIERYSHVMHIVSTVVGELAVGKTAYDLLRATFPAGTLSGAPKPMAMKIIEELEPSRRGWYAGVIGYLDFAGDMDTAIAIRTAVLHDGIAYVQAGAGLVADSDPVAEDAECRHKAAAVLRAIAAAMTLRAG